MNVVNSEFTDHELHKLFNFMRQVLRGRCSNLDLEEFKAAIERYEKANHPIANSKAMLDDLVTDLARETYDRFVMGGWEPQDAHQMIRHMLLEYNACEIERCQP